jgi:hypothetical protein
LSNPFLIRDFVRGRISGQPSTCSERHRAVKRFLFVAEASSDRLRHGRGRTSLGVSRGITRVKPSRGDTDMPLETRRAFARHALQSLTAVALIEGLASISTEGVLAPEIVPICSETPCFLGLPRFSC